MADRITACSGPRQAVPAAVTLVNAHGTFQCTPYLLDQAITRLLPASVNDLRDYFAAEIDPGGDYSDVHWVGEYLIMFASSAGELAERGSLPPWKRW